MEKESLAKTRILNNKIAWLISDWTNDTPDGISESTLTEIDPENSLPKDVLYRAVFCGLNQLDDLDEDLYRVICEEYLDKSIKCLDVKTYRNNSYYRNISFPKVERGGWKFTRLEYKPYEAFIRDDILYDELSSVEVPQMGFFTERFSYPAVLQNGREWMAIKPSEIESMQPSLELISGSVVTFGLGLGYFAYMASRKKDVSKVTIVERDESVISLFKEYILPQFANAKKIDIIKSDAFDYMDKVLPEENFDYAFVDLWHDTSDGLPLYIKAKGFEKKAPQTKFLYWVEESLISAYRWNIFEDILQNVPDSKSALELLKSEKLAEDLSK